MVCIKNHIPYIYLNCKYCQFYYDRYLANYITFSKTSKIIYNQIEHCNKPVMITIYNNENINIESSSNIIKSKLNLTILPYIIKMSEKGIYISSKKYKLVDLWHDSSLKQFDIKYLINEKIENEKIFSYKHDVVPTNAKKISISFNTNEIDLSLKITIYKDNTYEYLLELDHRIPISLNNIILDKKWNINVTLYILKKTVTIDEIKNFIESINTIFKYYVLYT